MTPFLYMVGMSKLFCSFSAGFNGAFYGNFYFVKSTIKTEHNTHCVWIDWLLNSFSFCIFVKHYLFFPTVLDVKSKHYKRNIATAVRSCCSLKFRNIHRKISVLVSLFDKVVGHKACSFIKKWLRHSCLPVNIAKFFKKQQVLVPVIR